MSDVTIQPQAAAGPLPDPILRALRRLVRRARMVALVRGLCAVAAVAASSMLAAMAVDAGFTLFVAWPRWAMSLSALGLTLLTAIFFLVRPLVRTFTLAGVARAIESRHPELQERISSAIELLTTPDAPHLRGSADLIAALAAEATQDASGVQARREVTLRSARPYLLAAAAAAALLASAFVLWPRQAGQAWNRVVAPYKDLPSVFADQLTVTPGDVAIAAGEPLTVEVQVANKAVTRAQFRRGGDDRDAVSDMTPLPAKAGDWPHFAVTCPPAAEGFRYRIYAGDAWSRYYNVTVVPRPIIERLDALYDYPAYTGRSPQLENGIGGDIHALAGTRVTLTAATNTPVTAATMLLNDEPLAQGQAVAGPDGATAWRFQFTLNKHLQGSYAIRLTKEIGGRAFTSVSDLHKLETLADGRPMVKITSPENLVLQLAADDKLPIFFAAGDDFGLATAELLVDVDGRRQFPTPLPIEEPGKAKALVSKTVLDLATLNAMGAGVITFCIHVTDNLPPELDGPQEAFSELHTIRIDAHAFTFGRQVVLAEELAIRESLELALRELQEAKKDSAQLRKVFKLSDANDAAAVAAVVPGVNAERIDRVVKHTGVADAAVRELLPRLTGDTFAPIADRLSAVADNHIAKAGNLAAQIKLAEDARSRGELADEADFQVDRGITVLSDMLKELTVLAQMLQRAQELADLAAKQGELADEMQAMLPTPSDQDEPTSQPTTDAASQPASAPASQPGDMTAKRNLMPPQEWQKQEGQVAKRLGELMKQSPKAMQQALSRGGAKTKDLAGEARKLAAQQVSVAELTNRVTPVTDQDRILRTQAEEQAALARRLAADTATSAPAAGAAGAAEQLRDGAADAALKALAQVQNSLAHEANQLNRQVMTSQLARQAESIAQQQRSISDQAADALRDHQAELKNSQASAQQLAQANQENQQSAAKVQSSLAELQQRQQKLAASAQGLQSALEKNPATPAAGKIKPSEPMNSAAQNMTPDKLPQAAEASRNANQQANQLATQAAADVSRAKPEGLDPQIKAAADAAAQAGKAAQAAAKTAAADLQTASDAAAKAAAAQAKAKDAQAKAEQLAVATTAPAAGTQPAADAVEAAKKLADAARNDAAASLGSANALKVAAENSKAAADAAAKAAADADKNHADLQTKKADFAKAAAEAKNLADQAAQLAAAQKKIDADLAELAAGPAAKLTQSAADAKAAQQEQAQHAKAADAALDRLAQLAKGQQDVGKQAADLAKAVEKATPQAQQAAAKSNPAASMEESRNALANKQAPQAAGASAQAAKTAKELADALRAADAAVSSAAASAAKQAQAGAKLQDSHKAAQDAAAAHEAARLAAAAAANAQPADAAKAKAAKDAADQAAKAAQAAKDAEIAAAEAVKATAAATQPADPQGAAAGQSAQAAAKALEAAQAAQDQALAQQAAADQAAKEAQAAAQAAQAASAADKVAAKAKAAQAQQAAAKAATAARQSAQAAAAAQRQAQSAQDAAASQAERVAATDTAQRSATAAKLAEAARAQEELRKRIETTAATRAKSAEALKNEQLAQLRSEQSKIAKDMGKLSDQVKTLAPQNDRLDTQGTRSTVEAAEQLEAALTPQAVAASEQAARDVTELAQRLGAQVDPAPASGPASGPAANKTVKGSTKQTPDQVAAEMDIDQLEAKRADMTAQSGQLAQRQQLVARQVKALAENRPLDMVPPRQDRLARQTSSLADDIDLLRLFSEDLIPDKAARQDANHAATQVEAAAAAQKQASAALAATSPQTAEPAQRAAAAALGQTADSLERLGQRMAELASKYPSDPNDEDTGNLDDAFEAAKRAARKPEIRDIELARKLLEELSKQSAQAMVAMGVPVPSSQNQQMPSSKATARASMGQVPVELLADELKAAGIRPGDWGLLPGELRDEILQSAGNEGPQEYRQLIKQYLEELAKRGGKR